VKRLVTLLFLVATCGCSDPPPAEEPYVRGAVLDLQHRATASGMLVEGGPGSREPCGIQATLDATTEYRTRARDGSLSEGSLADIVVGDTVEVYVEGPVAESCPVQGKAARIVKVRS
jgi:hypothetical protein